MPHCLVLSNPGDALISFEPLDMIARFAKRLTDLVPDPDGLEGAGVKPAVMR